MTKIELVRRLMDDTTELHVLRERETARAPVETALFKLRTDFEQATKWVRQEADRTREDAEKMTKQAVTILDTAQKLIEVAHAAVLGKLGR